jgi:hypothetical protein
MQNDTQNRGIMYLTITNPFTLGGSAILTFRSPTGTPASQAITPISKNVALTAAANATTPSVTTVAVNFTGQELRRILGQDLVAEFSGTTVAGSLTVTPAQKITVTSRLQLNVTIKEQ